MHLKPAFALIAVVVLTLGIASTIAQEKGPKKGGSKKSGPPGLVKPAMRDTLKLNVYADNWFMLYINGELVAVDSIRFLPHNVVSVDILPQYPMTIAVMARDNADPKTGMEYANTQLGDGGFILKLGDGTVTDEAWKVHVISSGPVDRDTNNPHVEDRPLPEDWYAVDFDDSSWQQASTYTQERVDPKQPYFEHDFNGAKFIWSDDLDLDNTVLFRRVVQTPPDGTERPDFSGLNDTVPAGRPKGGRPK